MGYRACLGFCSLAKTYSSDAAGSRQPAGLRLQAYSYQSLKSILKRSLDRQPIARAGQRQAPVRTMTTSAAPQYYDPPPNAFLQ